MGFIQIEDYYLNVSQIVYVEDLGSGIGYKAVIKMTDDKTIETEKSYGEVLYLIKKAGKEGRA